MKIGRTTLRIETTLIYWSSRRRANAFTLLELAIVIAILGVLAALLVSSLKNAKVRATRVSCLNNLRQQGVGLASFIFDHSEYPLFMNLQAGQSSTLGGWQKGTWTDSILSSAGVPTGALVGGGYELPRIMICPGSGAQPGREISKSLGYGYNNVGYQDASGNRYYLGLGAKTNRTGLVPVPSSEVVSPSAMIAVGDGIRGYENELVQWSAAIGIQLGLKRDADVLKAISARHLGDFNYLHCDGHVAGKPLKNVFFRPPIGVGFNVWFRNNSDSIPIF